MSTTMATQEPQALVLREAAARLGVSRRTLLRAIREGRVHAYRLRPGGDWRVPTAEVRRLLGGPR